MGEAALSARTEHAEPVGVVHHQPGIEAFGQREQFRQGREIAVHAEYRVGENQLAPGAALLQPTGERVRIAMRIAHVLGAGQQGGVDQRGVIQLVGENGVVAPDQRGGDGQIRHIAGGEVQRPLPPDERRELLFQFRVRSQVAADRVRSAAADTPAAGRFPRRRDERGMVRQSEVIVAAKGDDAPTFDHGFRAAGRVQRPAATQQTISSQLGQAGFQFVPDHIPCFPFSSPAA